MGAVTGLSLMMLLLASPSAGAAASTARATEAPAKPQPAVEKLSCGELLAESARLDAEMAQLSDKLAQVDVPVSARTHALTGAGTALAAVAGNLPLPLAANALSAVGAKAVVKSHSDDVARAAAPILGQQDVAQARFDHVTTLYQNKCLNLK